MRSPIILSMFDHLKNLVLSNKEKEFNQELGMVGDYLEERGDPEYKLCRVYWRIFPDPHERWPWVRFYFPEEEIIPQEELGDGSWATNSTSFLWILPQRMGTGNVKVGDEVKRGLIWFQDHDWMEKGGGSNYDFHRFFRRVP